MERQLRVVTMSARGRVSLGSGLKCTAAQGSLGAKWLGVDPRLCLALKDSHNGVRSASSAGMMTMMVPDLLEPTDEIRGLCAFVARDLHEVRSLILAVETTVPY